MVSEIQALMKDTDDIADAFRRQIDPTACFRIAPWAVLPVLEQEKRDAEQRMRELDFEIRILSDLLEATARAELFYARMLKMTMKVTAG
jgi:hypothetical protein